MYSTFLTPEALKHWVEDASTEKLTAALEDVWAQMLVKAPSLKLHPAAFEEGLIRSILRSAAIRYATSDAGALATHNEATGPFNEGRTFKQEDILTRTQERQLEEAERAYKSQAQRRGLQEADLYMWDEGPRDELLWRPL